LGKVQFTIQQTLKARSAVAEVDADDAIVHFAEAPQPLPSGADRMAPALGRSRFVQAADGCGVSMIASDQALAHVAQFAFFPLDRFQETL